MLHNINLTKQPSIKHNIFDKKVNTNNNNLLFARYRCTRKVVDDISSREDN